MSSTNSKLHVIVKKGNEVLFTDSFSHFPVVVGRSSSCHVSIPAHFISRTHCAITVENNNIVVKDLGSLLKISSGAGRTDQISFRDRGHFLISDIEFSVKLEKNQTILNPLTVVQPPKTSSRKKHPIQAAAGPEIVIEEDDYEVRPLFEGKLGEFQWVLEQEVLTSQSNDLALQGVVTWGAHIFDIRNFIVGDKVRISPSLQDEISLPALGRKLVLGKVHEQGATFQIRKDLAWSLTREGYPLDFALLINEGRLQEDPKKFIFTLMKNEILTVSFTPELKSHFRYICKPRPFFPRSWIENKEEFKKAIQISVGVHLLISLISLFSASPVEAPHVENVPPRFARLLVEPPKAPLAAPLPPPPPEPTPVPESPKPVVQEKPVPPPKLPPIPMKAKTQAAKPKPAQPIAKANQPVPNPVSNAPAKGEPLDKPVASEPSPAEREAAALADLLNAVPSPGAQGTKIPDNVKVVKSGGIATPGIKVGGIAGAVSSNGAPVASGLGKTPSALAGAGQGGFAETGGSKAGKRQVKGVLAEAPSFQGNEQGLSQDELMKIINQHISAIQRCYERSLFENPQLVGRVEYEWTITPQGMVELSQVKRSDMVGADSLNQCVLKVITSMKFPNSKNGLPTVASVGFPFGKQ